MPYTLLLIGFNFIYAGARRFRDMTADLKPPIIVGVLSVTAITIPFLMGLTGVGTILLNTLSAIILTLCAIEHWRSKDHPDVALNANAILYCVTALSFLCCAAVLTSEGRWVLTAPPENWAEDFNSIMSLVGLTGIGALTPTPRSIKPRTAAETRSGSPLSGSWPKPLRPVRSAPVRSPCRNRFGRDTWPSAPQSPCPYPLAPRRRSTRSPPRLRP